MKCKTIIRGAFFFFLTANLFHPTSWAQEKMPPADSYLPSINEIMNQKASYDDNRDLFVTYHPKDILLKVKLIAVQRQVSVSGLLTKILETLVEEEDAYVHAQRRHLQWLEEGFDLGTAGQIMTQRDELHERS